MSINQITYLVIALVLAVFVLIFVPTSFTRVDAGQIVVCQNSLTSSMTVYDGSSPGYKFTPFSKITVYLKSFQYWFSKSTDQGNTTDQSIPIRFNDGAKGTISGGVRVDMPNDAASILAINATFGSQDAVEQQLIRTVVEKAVNMTGPLMSSKESYADKRADLISDIEDQAKLGVYKTTTTETIVKDDLTGEQKQVNLVQIVKDSNNNPLRQEDSPLTRFNIKMYNLSLNSVDYSDTVEAQIAAQQQATQAVQTAMATAKKAEQDAITAEKEGEASATKAKWEQETENAKVVATAEGLAKAAEQNKLAAGFNKDAAILDGEGQAEKKRLLTQANNNLDQKLDAWLQAQQAYAQAIANCRGNLVPAVITGGGSTGTPSNVNDLIGLIQAKTARDLSLDMSMTSNTSNLPLSTPTTTNSTQTETPVASK